MESFANYTKRHFENQESSLQNEIENLIDCIRTCSRNRKTIYIIGNGGSATTAEHFATDLNLNMKRGGASVRAFSLAQNTGTFTAISNDIDYSESFSLLLRNLLIDGDLVVSFSASGNSENVIKAVEFANQNGNTSFSILGFDGGQLKAREVGKIIHFKTKNGEYGLVENLHLMLVHYIVNQLLD